MDPPTPMKVVHVSTAATWRGGEGQVYLLAKGLRDRGHVCVVLAREGGPLGRRLGDAGFDVRDLPGGKGPRTIWKIRRVLKDIRPDVAHFHDAHALTAGGAASWGLGIPLRVASRRVDFPIRSSWKYRRLCDRVLAISHAIAAMVRQGGVPDDRIRIVHSGVDPERLASGDRARGRASLDLDPNERLLLCVAALTDEKGHGVLLRSLQAVLERHPKLVVALAGDGEARESLADEAARLGVDGRVRLLGHRDDVPDLLHAADLFVMPSLREGLGTSLMDAMLVGVPVVCTTAGGMPEVVGADGSTDEPAAFVCPPGDVEGLAEALLQALDSPDRCERMRGRAMRRAREMFTADRMVEGTLAVYLEALGDSAAGSAAEGAGDSDADA